jgi:hypothetical protein
MRSSFGGLTKGRQFQLSKYAHNWTLTLHQWATQDNSIDWHCFACGAWWEDINHVLRCPSDRWAAAWDKAKTQFLDHLTKYYTRTPMDQVIMAALDQWLANLPPALVPRLPKSPNSCSIWEKSAFKRILTTMGATQNAQWRQNFGGHVAKTAQETSSP